MAATGSNHGSSSEIPPLGVEAPIHEHDEESMESYVDSDLKQDSQESETDIDKISKASPHQIQENFIAPELLARMSEQQQSQRMSQNETLSRLQNKNKNSAMFGKSQANAQKDLADDLKNFSAIESQQKALISTGLSRFLCQQMAVELLWEKFILPREDKLVEAFQDHVMDELRTVKRDTAQCARSNGDASKRMSRRQSSLSSQRGLGNDESDGQIIQKRCQKHTIGDSFFHFLKLYFESNKDAMNERIVYRYIDYLTQLHNDRETINKHTITSLEYKIFVDYIIDIFEKNIPEFQYPEKPSIKEIHRISANRIILTSIRYHLEKLCLIFCGEITSWNATNIRIQRSDAQWMTKRSLLEFTN